MNLTGPERASIERGQVICHEKLSLTSDRFDAFLEVRPAARQGHQKSSASAHSLGAAERLGKIVVLGDKEKARAQRIGLLPDHARTNRCWSLRGDHFIVRDETARRTLAGGAGDQSLGETAQTRAIASLLTGSKRCTAATRDAHSKPLSTSSDIVRRADRLDSSVSQHQGRTDARCHRHDETAARLECRGRKALHHRTKMAAHQGTDRSNR